MAFGLAGALEGFSGFFLLKGFGGATFFFGGGFLAILFLLFGFIDPGDLPGVFGGVEDLLSLFLTVSFVHTGLDLLALFGEWH